MKITLVTVTEPKKIGKRFYLEGGAVKKSTVGNAAGGVFEVVNVANMSEFAAVLSRLSPHHALIYGIPRGDIRAFTSEKRIGLPAFGADKYITRTKEHFKWDDSAGILMLDYDPDYGRATLGKDDLIAALRGVLGNFSYVWSPSSSSYIFNGDKQYSGLKGQRVYIPIANMRDAERAGETIIKRLWLAGFGSIQLSRAGSMLTRCLFDSSVWQSQRLDFAGGALCVEPINQRRGEPFVYDGEPLDSMDRVTDLSPEEHDAYLKAVDAAKRDVAPERAVVQAAWVESNAIAMTGGAAVDSQEYTQAVKTLKRALDSCVLYGDFPIHITKTTTVTVGEILDDPSKYHGLSILDPLEPEYNGFHKCAKLYVIDGRKNLYSQAHGGKNYKLIRTPRKVEFRRGAAIEAQEATLDIMRLSGDLYDFGNNALVRIDGGRACETNASMLWTWCARSIQYFSSKKTKEGFEEIPLDPPRDMVDRIVQIRSMRELCKLDAVITAPLMRLDGSILNRSGYDEFTRLFYDFGGDEVAIPRNPSRADIIAAYDVLMYPFREFPFAVNDEANGINLSVFLSALLTAVMRPVLPTSPAFGFDAPTIGSGKTMLAQCVGILATGSVPPVFPPVNQRDDEEVRKRVFSFLLSGDRVILWDNIVGQFDSASVAAAITSPSYQDRVMGGNTIATIPNRSLLLITGNNLTLTGDMPRRVLKCRINSGLDASDNAQRRVQYAVNPLHYCATHRLAMVTAALTLLTACHASGYNHGRGRLASFEEWDMTVRNTVCWLASMSEFEPDLCDPAIAAAINVADDPENEVFIALFAALQSAFGTEWFSAKSAFNRGNTDETLEDAISDASTAFKPSVKSFGILLMKSKDKNAGGKILAMKRDNHTKVNMFSIIG